MLGGDECRKMRANRAQMIEPRNGMDVPIMIMVNLAGVISTAKHVNHMWWHHQPFGGIASHLALFTSHDYYIENKSGFRGSCTKTT